MDIDSPRRQLGIVQLRIIAGAIVASPVLYVIVALVLHHVGFGHPLAENPLCWAILGFGVLMGVGSIVLHSALTSPRAAKRMSGGNTMGHFFRWSLITMALSEVPSAMGLVCFILSGNAVMLAIGVALSLALAAAIFPTPGRYDAMCAGLETIPDDETSEGGASL